ncbi:MAG: hypothetical protein ACYDEX_17460 [Mobilitalea sp.]
MASTRQNQEKSTKLKKHSLHKDGMRTFLLLLPYGSLFLTFIAIPIAVAIGLSFNYFDTINMPTFAG